jgi:hypothetical protein
MSVRDTGRRRLGDRAIPRTDDPAQDDPEGEGLLDEVREQLTAIRAQLAARRVQQDGWPTVHDLAATRAPASETLNVLVTEAARAICEDLAALRRLLELEQRLQAAAPTRHH